MDDHSFSKHEERGIVLPSDRMGDDAMDIELNARKETPHSLLSTVGHIQDEVEAVHATEDMVERSTRINVGNWKH